MKKPPAGQGPFQRGERLTAAKLNDVVSSIRPVRVGGRAGLMGDTIVSDETDSAYIRVTGRTGGKYAWVEVYRTPNGTWANTSRTGNTTYDWAVERNNATVSAGSTVYEAKRSVDTSEWIFTQGASGGNVNITSGETVLMILGTYADYDQCPNVPASPPTAITDYCNQTSGTELCVPAYAYAVYQRCGYVWNKVGDTRTYQVWANELNGGSTGAYRRFHIPRWGGNLTAGVPGTDDDCMGVAFYGGGGSALTCSCPPCLSGTNGTLCVEFRTIPRPTDPAECASLVLEMDTYNAWDKEFTIELTPAGSWCSVGGSDPDGIFTFGWDWQDGASLSCDWGPDVFDPCNPCEHWGRLLANIEVPGGNDPNCGGGGHWTGEFKATEICNLLCDCFSGEVAPIDEVYCGGCGNVTPPQFNVIVEGSVRITCCPPTEAFFGGNETSAFTEAYFGGNETASYTEAIYGGGE
jgi:hypothetical protein